MLKRFLYCILLVCILQNPANAGTWHLAPIIDGASSTWHQLSCNPNFLSQWQPVGCSYSCPNGSLAGQSCIINTTAYIGATLNYYCPWGGYFDGGSTCIVPYTYGAIIVGWNYGWSSPAFSFDYWSGRYFWAISWDMNCTFAVWNNSYVYANWGITDNIGSYASGGTVYDYQDYDAYGLNPCGDGYGYVTAYFDIVQWQPQSPIYACYGGDWYDGGSTCYSNWYYGAPSYYSCPGGWSLSGSSCTSGSISIVPAAKSPRTGW